MQNNYALTGHLKQALELVCVHLKRSISKFSWTKELNSMKGNHRWEQGGEGDLWRAALGVGILF